jgi:hypothetical protein
MLFNVSVSVGDVTNSALFSLFFLRLNEMELNRDFSVEPFQQRKRMFRADKGKKQSYPKQRKRWNLISHGQTNMNLNLNQTTKQNSVMDTNKPFKNSPEIREYWRIYKQQQRAPAKLLIFLKFYLTC